MVVQVTHLQHHLHKEITEELILTQLLTTKLEAVAAELAVLELMQTHPQDQVDQEDQEQQVL
tara:strand:- start:205 stop:390 length:186 start_codon:yes stop_codon:yes gene_type:complete